MSITSTAQLKPNFAGDITYGQQLNCEQGSNGLITQQTLASGANTITVPSASCVWVIIIPPSSNTQTLTLKGVTGDTGIALSKTGPFLLSLASVSSFVLTAGGTITGVRFIWG
jgi:hypothetical protein